MNVGRASGFCDDGGASVLDALAWQDVQARSDSFYRRLGEAREEFLGRHIAEASVRADGVASDPGRKATIAMAERAGEDIGERLARDDAQAFDVVAEASALGDRLNKFRAGCMPGTMCLDRDIAGVQGKDEQPDQGRVIDSVHFETLDQRLGAQRADDLVTLVGNLGSGFLRDGRLVALAAVERVLAFLRFRFGHAEDDFMDGPVARMDCEADLVALLRLRPCALRLWRQLFAAVFVDVEQDAVLGHVGVEPCTLSGHEGLAVDGEAIVLVPFGEQVLLPDDAECRALVLAKLGVPGEEAGLVERLGDPPPDDALALLRFELLPDCGLILARGGGDGAKLRLLGMSPAPI